MTKGILANYKKLSGPDLKERFLNSCSNGNLEEVSFLMDNPILRKGVSFNIKEIYDGYNIACIGGQLEIFKFFVTTPKMVDILAKADLGMNYTNHIIYYIAGANRLNIMRYYYSGDNKILRSPPTLESIAVRDAFVKASLSHHLEMVNFFLFDLEYKVTDYAKKRIAGVNITGAKSEEVLKLIKKQELFLKINSEVISNQVPKSKKFKI